MSQLEQVLLGGLQELAISHDQQLPGQLLAYLELLQRWNKAYNLTATRNPEQMVYRHLLDSLVVAPFVRSRGGPCVDVGTGAGLPGIPLALLFPQREFHLVDSNGKKTRFLFQVKTSLGLDNITIHNTRVELFTPPTLFDVVLSRAFASLQDMVESCRHLCASTGSFMAMKGSYPSAELEALPDQFEVVNVHKLAVPGLPEARHLVELGFH